VNADGSPWTGSAASGALFYADQKCPGGKTPVACMCNIDTDFTKIVLVANPIQTTDTCRCYYSNTDTALRAVRVVAVQAVCPVYTL
jgi:hypothetical protein